MQRQVITGSVAGGEDLIYSASGGEFTKVMAYRLTSPGGVGAGTWGSNGTSLSGEIALVSGSNFAEDSEFGLFETVRGENLTLSSANVSLQGHIVFKVFSS